MTGLGSYFLSLYQDWSWVVRRVETVALLDNDRHERRVTLDLDVARLNQQWIDAGLSPLQRPLVPLSLIDKDLLLDFDVRFNGEPIHVLTSTSDSEVARAMLLTLLAERFPGAQIPPVVESRLLDITRSMPSEDDRRRIRGRDVGPVEIWELDGSDDEYALWEGFFDDVIFVDALSTLTLQYMPIIQIPDESDIAILKYRVLETGLRISPGRRGLVRAACAIEAPNIGRAARTHVRVIAPPGTHLTSGALWSITPSSATQARTTARVGANNYLSRTTHERGVIYTTDPVKVANYWSVFTVIADTKEFLRPALATSAVSAVLMLLGAIGQYFAGLLSEILAHEAEAAVVIILAIPSAYALQISRRGEHAVRSQLLQWPRYALLSVIPVIVAAAIALLFSEILLRVSLTTIWGLAGLWSLAITIYLLIVTLSTHLQLRAAQRRGNRTVERRIIESDRPF